MLAIQRPEPVPVAAGKGDGEGRPLEPFLEPGGDEADDARMPGFARRHHGGAALLGPTEGSASASASATAAISIAWRSRLSRSSSAAIGRASSRPGPEEPRAERGIADPSAGIDPRSGDESEMIGPRRTVGAGGIEQRGQPRPAALVHDLQPRRQRPG